MRIHQSFLIYGQLTIIFTLKINFFLADDILNSEVYFFFENNQNTAFHLNFKESTRNFCSPLTTPATETFLLIKFYGKKTNIYVEYLPIAASYVIISKYSCFYISKHTGSFSLL